MSEIQGWAGWAPPLPGLSPGWWRRPPSPCALTLCACLWHRSYGSPAHPKDLIPLDHLGEDPSPNPVPS